MKTFLRPKTLLAIALAFPLLANALTLIPAETDSLSWHQSTVLGAFAVPQVPSYVVAKIDTPRKGRQLNINIWRTKTKPPKGLFLLIPGTGANADSAQASIFADLMVREGYDAVIVANPFSPDFQDTFSKDRLIGFPQNDTLETIKMLEAAYKAYVQRRGVPKVIHLAGISLGGTYAVRLANFPTKLKIDRYLAVNPPVELGHAIEKIDESVRVRLNSNMFSWREVIFGNLLPLAELTWIRGVRVEGKSIKRIKAKLSESEIVNMGIIGMSFQQSLIGIAGGLSKAKPFTPLYKSHWLSRQLPSMTFGKYMGIAGIAIEKGNLPAGSFDDLMEEVDLRAQLDEVPNLKKVYIIHSADDFLLEDGDLEDLEDRLGSNLQVLASGGHCGAIWTDAFKKAFLNTLK